MRKFAVLLVVILFFVSSPDHGISLANETCSEEGKYVLYIIPPKAGLSWIANIMNVPEEKILSLNPGIKDRHNIVAGDVLCLPIYDPEYVENLEISLDLANKERWGLILAKNTAIEDFSWMEAEKRVYLVTTAIFGATLSWIALARLRQWRRRRKPLQFSFRVCR